MGRTRFAACRAIVDTLADEPVEAFDREPAPRDAGRKNDGPRTDDIAAIEVDLARSRIDASDGARDQNLRPETPRLLECPTCELVARDAARETEIVLDARGRPCLAAGCLALNHEGAETLGRAVYRRRETCRAATDDHGVVFGKACARLKAEALGEGARCGSTAGRP